MQGQLQIQNDMHILAPCFFTDGDIPDKKDNHQRNKKQTPGTHEKRCPHTEPDGQVAAQQRSQDVSAGQGSLHPSHAPTQFFPGKSGRHQRHGRRHKAADQSGQDTNGQHLRSRLDNCTQHIGHSQTESRPDCHFTLAYPVRPGTPVRRHERRSQKRHRIHQTGPKIQLVRRYMQFFL